jgi:hypothetical protein
VNSPSAERLAAAFGAFRDSVLEAEAFAALIAALEPVDAGLPPREATLIDALGHLGHAAALSWLVERGTGTDDPALQAAIAAAQARLGAPVAIERCAALFLGKTTDAVALLAADDARVRLLADVLSTVPAGARPLAADALLRGLELPHLAPHAARALAALYPPAPGAPVAAVEPAPAPAPADQAPMPAAPTPAPVASAVPLDPDRTLELSTSLLPAVAEVQPYAPPVPERQDWPTSESRPAPQARWTPEGEGADPEEGADLAWMRGMGYMRWLPAQTGQPEKPRVLATVVVITPGATVHAERGPEYPVVKTARRGDAFSVVGKTSLWWKILFPNGITGWIERRNTAIIVPHTDEGAPAPVEAARPGAAVYLAQSR